MALSLTRCYLTVDDCTEVFSWAGNYTFTTTSTPTLAQVEGYVYTAAALIETQTQIAGALTSPPASSISTVRIRQLLTDANAIGAAFLARLEMYVSNQDEPSHKAAQALAGLWQTYLGKGAINTTAGLASLNVGEGGLIQQTIASLSGSNVHASDVTEGYAVLADASTVTIAPPFTMDQVD